MDSKIKDMLVKFSEENNVKLFEGKNIIMLLVPCKGERFQDVGVMDWEDGEFVKIVSIISRMDANLDLTHILRINTTLNDGTVGILDWDLEDGQGNAPCLVFSSTQRVATADYDEIKYKINYAANTSDMIEEALTDTDKTQTHESFNILESMI